MHMYAQATLFFIPSLQRPMRLLVVQQDLESQLSITIRCFWVIAAVGVRVDTTRPACTLHVHSLRAPTKYVMDMLPMTK